MAVDDLTAVTPTLAPFWLSVLDAAQPIIAEHPPLLRLRPLPGRGTPFGYRPDGIG